MRVLSPPEIFPQADGKTIFLAGPIQGSTDWQSVAVKMIAGLDPTVAIANPRRDYMDGEFIYEDQVDWETAHLQRAGSSGSILFWLAREHDHDCGRAYAQTTRFELAEWITRHQLQGAKLCIGAETGFSGFRYIRHRLQLLPKIPLCSTLEETCRAAVALAALD